MARLSDLAEQLTAGMLLASPTNLPGLANLHELLHAMAGETSKADGVAENKLPHVSAAAQNAANLAERIILRDIPDAQAAILGDGIISLILDLPGLINLAAHP